MRARRFFRPALATLKVTLTEMVTDKASTAWHHVEQYENNRIEADHSRLKHRLRPTRGPRTDHTAQVVITGLAYMQNPRRGHHEIAIEASRHLRDADAFTELAHAI